MRASGAATVSVDRRTFASGAGLAQAAPRARPVARPTFLAKRNQAEFSNAFNCISAWTWLREAGPVARRFWPTRTQHQITQYFQSYSSDRTIRNQWGVHALRGRSRFWPKRTHRRSFFNAMSELEPKNTSTADICALWVGGRATVPS